MGGTNQLCVLHQGHSIYHGKEHHTESSDKLSLQSKLFHSGFSPVASIYYMAYAQFVDATFQKTTSHT